MIKEAGFGKLPLEVEKGLASSLKGDTPFLLTPITWPMKKLLGEAKADRLLFDYVQHPLVKADVAVGRGLQKATSKVFRGRGKGIWQESRTLGGDPTSTHPTQTGGKEYKIPSALAPINKAGRFVIPLLGAIKLDEILKRRSDMAEKKITEADLKKTAEMLLNLKDQNDRFEKQAKATELLYKQAEMGMISFPKTFANFQEKVAELLGKDLNVVEEAIKLASSSEGSDVLGGLDNSSSVGSPREHFHRAILNQ